MWRKKQNDKIFILSRDQINKMKTIKINDGLRENNITNETQMMNSSFSIYRCMHKKWELMAIIIFRLNIDYINK